MEPSKVAADEARRIAQHEKIKEKLEDDVHDRIAEKAKAATPGDQAQLGSVATGLKQKAAAEVLETEGELERARSLGRVSQVIDYVFFLAYSLIGLEIVLELLAARQSSGFKQLLDAVTTPLLAPFRGLMPGPLSTVGEVGPGNHDPPARLDVGRTPVQLCTLVFSAISAEVTDSRGPDPRGSSKARGTPSRTPDGPDQPGRSVHLRAERVVDRGKIPPVPGVSRVRR